MVEIELEVLVETDPPDGFDSEQLGALVSFVLSHGGPADARWTLAVVLTDDERLRALHRDHMGLDTETDVMTFPCSGEPEADGDWGGDVVLSVERAAAQAPEFGHSAQDEVRFLVVHGLLHLCGWDDGTDDARAAMLDEQARLIALFDNLPPSLPNEGRT
ncbi:MAG: hypothetical protein AVDCRST_MAG73-2500 [uncultured Thermomicrobiales bacterium]|uniref:Endoribonuclease YbeY n=1 Tax=uncultured Thermomicrobiales bacterium TaxID=1645740 RepID=A0A6J4UFQ7_9BACT|nr:MAG: hypothetical protein AVDCRST_MAG73-2500 [uncultured Thermomicrobiales bacterium]